MIVRRPVRLTVAGRTDAGVHARGQVAHFDVTPEEWDGLRRGHDSVPEESLKRRLNGALGRVLGELRGTVQIVERLAGSRRLRRPVLGAVATLQLPHC